MRDIERELRALGEAERESDGQAQLDRGSLRRIRMNRMLISGVAALAILGLVGGGTYAANMLSSQDVLPAEVPDLDPGAQLLFAPVGDGRITLALDVDAGTVCYLEPVPEGTTELRIEHRLARSNPVVLDLAEPGANQGYCTDGVNEEKLDLFLTATENYFLLLVTPDGAESAPLESVLGDNPDCEALLGFEPTYLPDKWQKSFKKGPPVGGDQPELLGYWGNGAERGSGEMFDDGFITLMISSVPNLPPTEGNMEVLGAPAELIESSKGAQVKFGYKGCSYRLIAFDLDVAEVVRFAEGLQPADENAPAEIEPTENGVTFQIALTQCSRDSESGLYCHVTGQVVNDSSEDVRLEDSWQILHFGDVRVPANNGPFREFFEDFATTRHAFAIPIEAGGELPADLFFPGTPEGECPDAIEFHASADSEGVVIPLERCLLD